MTQKAHTAHLSIYAHLSPIPEKNGQPITNNTPIHISSPPKHILFNIPNKVKKTLISHEFGCLTKKYCSVKKRIDVHKDAQASLSHNKYLETAIMILRMIERNKKNLTTLSDINFILIAIFLGFARNFDKLLKRKM